MRKYLTILIFLHFFAQTFFSQNLSYIDSLKRVLTANVHDSIIAHAQYLIAYSYIDINLDSALKYNALGILSVKKTRSERKESILLDELGYIHLYKGEYDKAISDHLAALKLHQKLGDKQNEAASLNGIGFIYYAQNNNEKSLKYYEQALNINMQLDNKKAITSSLHYIGNIYRNKKDFTKALSYFMNAFKKLDSTYSDTESGDIYMDIAETYEEMGNSDQALKYAEISLYLFEKTDKINARVGDILQVLSKIYKSKHNTKKAIEYGERSFKIGEELEIVSLKIVSSQLLAECYAETGDFKNGYRYEALSHELEKNELTSAEKVSEIEAKYYKEKEEEIRQKEEVIRAYKETLNRYILFAIIAVFILLSFFIYSRYKNKKKANELLHEKNKIIEEKQKEILDSIHYANRIQKSQITSEKYIEKELNRLNKNNS